ncbi:hypothetical protein [Nocardioides sp.]|uniref:hypothetical protein n=1 Tax=Nocardioides sp. TaxID=35761 RepID=UPI0035684EAF
MTALLVAASVWVACSSPEQPVVPQKTQTQTPSGSATSGPTVVDNEADWPAGFIPVTYAPGVFNSCGLESISEESVWLLDCSGLVVIVNDGQSSTLELPGAIAASDGILLRQGGAVDAVDILLTADSNDQQGELLTYDVMATEVLRTLAIGSGWPTAGAVIGRRSVVSTLNGRIVEIRGGSASALVEGLDPLIAIAASRDTVWGVSETGTVTVLPEGKAVRLPSNVKPAAALAVGESVWVATTDSGLFRVGRSGARSLHVPGGINTLVRCSDGVWIAQQRLGATFGSRPGLRRLDPSGRILDTIPMPDGPNGLSCFGQSLWIHTERGTLLRRMSG